MRISRELRKALEELAYWRNIERMDARSLHGSRANVKKWEARVVELGGIDLLPTGKPCTTHNLFRLEEDKLVCTECGQEPGDVIFKVERVVARRRKWINHHVVVMRKPLQ